MTNESSGDAEPNDPPTGRETTPTVPSLDPTRIPAALRERPQWVCWKYITRGGKQTKCPVNARGGGRADSTDPATWASFDEVVAAWKAGEYAGIGYVFSADGPFAGIDLDGCIDDAGNIVSAARQIIDALNSYTEISPSGRGVKVFIAARKPEGVGCKSKAIAGFKESEVYDRDRFFTVTGQRVPDTPAGVEDRQVALDALCIRLWPKKRPPHLNGTVVSAGFSGDDEALIQRAGAAKNGERFKKLWAGDTSLHADDHSGADQALCNLLAFWTGKDAARMDRLFRRSGLFRDKWDEKRGEHTYGQKTIDSAIADCTETFSPRRRSPPRSEASASSDAREPGERDDLLVQLGQKDPASGRLVLSPRRTLPTAEAYAREFNQHTHGRTLHGYGGLLMEWRGNRYCQVEEEWLKQRLQPWLHKALRYVLNKQTGEMELVDFESNPTTVRQALDTIRAFVHLPASTVSPSWLDGGKGRPPALELLPCKSLNLHIPTGRVLPEVAADDDLLSTDQIAAKVSGHARGELPIGCTRLTMFVDVQGKALFYLVAAWEDDFTGYVIDYGTEPDQKAPYFTLRDVRRTLAAATPSAGVEGAIFAGLERLTEAYLAREWRRDDGAMVRIDRCLIDANWGSSTDVVYQFCRQSSHAGVLTPSHGRYVGASSIPFSEYKRKRGDRVGLNWRIPVVTGKRAVRHVIFDTNYWKSFAHARLAVPMGDPGCLSLFGSKPESHRLLSEHLTSEYRVKTEGRGRTVDEWKLRVEGLDNHWLDCLVGSAVAASMQGAILFGTDRLVVARPRVKLSELRGGRR